MQIQEGYQPVIRKLLYSDQFIQNLFQRPQSLFKQIQSLIQDKQENPDEQIYVDRENIDKGYMSEGQQKLHNIHPNKRKNSLIKKMKIKEKKKKTRQNKIYIEMLQNRVLQLQKSLESATKLNDMNKEYLKKLSEGEHIMNGLFVSKQRHIENLQFLLKQQTINNQALKKQYSNMRFRQGVFGKDRTKAINYYFSQMSQMFFTDTLKYLIKTAQNGQDFFEPQLLKNGYYSYSKSPQDIVGNLALPNQSILYLSQLKEQILAQKNVLDQQFQNFYNSKVQLLKTARRLQMIVDSMQRYSNNQQIAKLIVLADQYRFKKSISVKQFHKSVFQKLSKEKHQYNPNNLFGIVALD